MKHCTQLLQQKSCRSKIPYVISSRSVTDGTSLSVSKSKLVYSSLIIVHTHTHPFNGPMSGITRVTQYQKGKTNLDFIEARDSEWQWHQLGTCKSAPRSRQITMSTPHHSIFLQAGCPSCRPTNSVKALKAHVHHIGVSYC